MSPCREGRPLKPTQQNPQVGLVRLIGANVLRPGFEIGGGSGMVDGDDAAKSGKYDQAFFLALAAKGKEHWNTWRRDPANKDVHVTFADADFSEAPRDQIDFSGFEFGDDADFSKCKWRGIKMEEAVQVAGGFNTTAFRAGQAFFRGAAFGQKANFNRASFHDWAIFLDASFGQDACFTGAAFGDNAILNTAFGMFADFTGASFGGCFEEGLRHGGLGAVVAEVARLSISASRRHPPLAAAGRGGR